MKTNSLTNQLINKKHIREGGNSSVVFVVGRPSKNDDENLQVSLEEESKMHGDMLQLDFLDHYNNLTLKTVGLLKYVITTHWKVGTL